MLRFCPRRIGVGSWLNCPSVSQREAWVQLCARGSERRSDRSELAFWLLFTDWRQRPRPRRTTTGLQQNASRVSVATGIPNTHNSDDREATGDLPRSLAWLVASSLMREALVRPVCLLFWALYFLPGMLSPFLFFNISASSAWISASIKAPFEGSLPCILAYGWGLSVRSLLGVVGGKYLREQ